MNTTAIAADTQFPFSGASYTADAEEAELWTDETSFPEVGCYKLGCDISASYVLTDGPLDVDLNGHTVDIDDITCFGHVIIRDTSSKKTGTINDSGTESLFTVFDELEVYGGTINGYSKANAEGTIDVMQTGSFRP